MNTMKHAIWYKINGRHLWSLVKCKQDAFKGSTASSYLSSLMRGSMVSASVPMSTIMPSWNPSVGWGAHNRLPILHCTPQLHRSSGRHNTHTSFKHWTWLQYANLVQQKVIVLFNANHVTVNKMYFRMLQWRLTRSSPVQMMVMKIKKQLYISHFKVLIYIMYKCTLKLDL